MINKQEKLTKVKLKGNESFNIREGWLRKGIRCVQDCPTLFSRDDAMEILGVGSKMVKSIRYWLRATGLTEERAPVGRAREQILTERFGEVIDQYDRYFDDVFTLFLLHYNIVKNSEGLSVAWDIFFNNYDGQDFTKENMIEKCKEELNKRLAEGATFSESLFADDCASILRMYNTSLKTLEFQERTLRVEEADVDEIINFKKGPLTFMILSLLYPDLKLSEIKWHQDHIHPRYAFDKNRLIKYFAEKGMKLDDNTLKAWAANSNTLVNLQLLTGKQNQEKSKTPLVTWIYNQFPDDDKRKKYCEEHYIDFDAGFELENFDAYYNRRREKLKKKLMEIFSVQVISEEETRIIEEQTSEEESVITPEGKTIAEAAVSVLIDHPEGLTCKQIYEAIMEQHLYEFKAEKPEVVLRIEIRRRCQNVDISKSYETKWFRIVKKVDGECYYGITFSD